MKRHVIPNCQNCGNRVSVQDMGAEVESRGVVRRWCLPCWDNDDEALRQFQLAQSGSGLTEGEST